MFQICNGILEFVAKTSLMISSYSDSFDHLQNLFETKPTIVSNMDVVHLGSFESPENVPLGVEEQVKLQEEYNEEVSEEGEYQEEAILCSTKTEGKESEAHITEEEEIEEEDEEGETKSEVEIAQDDELEEITSNNNKWRPSKYKWPDQKVWRVYKENEGRDQNWSSKTAYCSLIISAIFDIIKDDKE